MKLIVLLYFFILPLLSFAQDNNETPSLEGVVYLSIQSDQLDENYDLYIGLPIGYNQRRKYNVLYVLDANVTFGMVNDIVRLLSFEQNPQVIVVGIAYKDFNEWMKKRGRDFMPNYGSNVKDTEVSKFYKFLQSELIPYINGSYNTNATENTLYGHSSGAVFGLYAMLTNPSHFKNYILTSPSVDEDKGYMKNLEALYFSNNKSLSVNLYTSIGKSEKSSFMTMYYAFVEVLKSRDYEGLNFLDEKMDGTHMSTMAPAFIKGFQYVNRHSK